MAFDKKKNEFIMPARTYSEDDLIAMHFTMTALKEQFKTWNNAEVRWLEQNKGAKIYQSFQVAGYELYSYGVILPAYDELANKLRQYTNWARRFYSLKTFGIPNYETKHERKDPELVSGGSKEVDIQESSAEISPVEGAHTADSLERELSEARHLRGGKEGVLQKNLKAIGKRLDHGSDEVSSSRPIKGDSLQENDLHRDS